MNASFRARKRVPDHRLREAHNIYFLTGFGPSHVHVKRCFMRRGETLILSGPCFSHVPVNGVLWGEEKHSYFMRPSSFPCSCKTVFHEARRNTVILWGLRLSHVAVKRCFMRREETQFTLFIINYAFCQLKFFYLHYVKQMLLTFDIFVLLHSVKQGFQKIDLFLSSDI
jgi:hypothetical protein